MNQIKSNVVEQTSVDFSRGVVTREKFHLMPLDYQTQCIRIMSMAAFSENLGGEGLTNWIGKAPDNRRKRLVAKLAYEEFDHGYRIYKLLKDLNVNEKSVNEIATGKAQNSNSIHASLDTADAIYGNTGGQWLDLALHCILMDTAGRHIVSNFAESSYGPWAEASVDIAKDELMHASFGKHELQICLAEGVSDELLQERFTYWYARSLNFFGPPPGKSARLLKHYGIKRKDNEDLRKEFRCEIELYMGKIGLRGIMKLNTDYYPYD